MTIFPTMKLNKYLALCGVASRRKSVIPIMEGRVAVNNEIVTEAGYTIDPEIDIVTLDGKQLSSPKKHVYVLLHKPASTLTTAKDERGRKTVLDLVQVDERIFPVGRLDYDTEGVLLLTNDGDLANRLAHPRYEVEKIYETWVEGQLSTRDLEKLQKGVDIDDDVVVQGEALILQKKDNKTQVEIHIHEGKKRQIKRMMKAVGHPVLYLKRVCFAGLRVDDMTKGTWRFLTHSEVDQLYQLVHMKRMNQKIIAGAA